MNKNSTAVVGLLSLFTLMVQASLVLFSLIMLWSLLSSADSRQEFIQVVLRAVDLSRSSLDERTYATTLIIFGSISGLFMFLYLNCIRHLLQNINEKFYFEEKNLKLIKYTLIFFTLYTLTNFSVVFVDQLFQIVQIPGAYYLESLDWLQIVDSLLTVMGIYVIYMVFRQGILLKRENQSII
ncbi:DUF2975 domain-containing protein [Candidatus Enterococcus ferrettii]|uniref:DUF2975 domain-containing protein n=1 Tax=Candidatus Enterococcus ferrettii TaxID=2815324 RepID=A0ABV0EIM9_9ENTE|nr:DUF2975 domain-containing protein [Enterococcus sp. 665A]MBO1340440.1 DUF2975 domain-containing protein [Enterococcus sp. 665A]